MLANELNGIAAKVESTIIAAKKAAKSLFDFLVFIKISSLKIALAKSTPMPASPDRQLAFKH